MKFSREWAMPSQNTFSIPPIEEFIGRYITKQSVIVDPFSGTSTLGTYRNDLGYGGLEAADYLDQLLLDGVKADVVLLDPPYSPRQMSECYKSVGLKVGMAGTQNARLYKDSKTRLTQLLKSGGYALTFGWNSAGFGKNLGFEVIEIMLVAHGGAHNDTICVAEQKL